ncbi:MAG: amino acid ABC transporter permease [Enterococcaceae bacterium]|nr:amino acid ABC transporter permease [Enterococcaceae bacterium]MCI1920157.1 amino acid ABC transporter permease [Enterococcaceae bacterium]
MNWSSIADVIPQYAHALALTAKLGFWGVFFSLFLGLLISLIQYRNIPVLERICRIYIELSRNTPLLIQLYFLYYGFSKFGMKFSENTSAIIALTFLGASYMAEAFRGGLEAVPNSQLESGKAIGLNDHQLMRYVLLPQAVTVSVPAVGANIIFLVKETSILSAISILDVMNLTRDLIGMYYRTNEYLLLLVASYAILLIPLSLFLTWLERRVRRGAFGN